MDVNIYVNFNIFIMILVLLSCFFWNIEARHVNWAINNGAYLHENLEYRIQGMYAINKIEEGEILAQVPISLIFKCDKCTSYEFDEKLKQSILNENKWTPFVKSLPTSCQNPLCEKTCNNTILTILGCRKLDKLSKKFTTSFSNLTSVAISRRFEIGMIPLIDLFNHKHNGDEVFKFWDINDFENPSMMVEASKTYENEEVFIKYGSYNLFQLYTTYGFIASHNPSCSDMTYMRVGLSSERISCIATSNSTIELMVKEISEAFLQNDTVMIKGAAQWLDKNIQH